MAISYKDINQLTKKQVPSGDEKIPISDTQYITPSDIASLKQAINPNGITFVDNVILSGAGASTPIFEFQGLSVLINNYSGLVFTGTTDWSRIAIQNGASDPLVTLQSTLDKIGLPSVTSSDSGQFLYVAYDSVNGWHWEKTASVLTIGSMTMQLGNNYTLYTRGSLGYTYMNTFGIHKDGMSDWSWIKDHYQSNGTTVVVSLQDTLDTKAPLASPALTGTPTAPTASAGTNTTQIATTAFVQTALSGKQNTITVSTSEPTEQQGSNGDIWIVI